MIGSALRETPTEFTDIVRTVGTSESFRGSFGRINYFPSKENPLRSIDKAKETLTMHGFPLATKPKPMLIVIADQPDILESIPEMLQPVEQVKLYHSAEQFLETENLYSCGCLIVDHGLPGISGLACIERLRESHSTLSSILVTGSADVSLVVNAFERGITAFLEKPLSTVCLQTKVDLAFRESIDAYTKRVTANREKRQTSRLTPRELEVFRLLTDGMHAKLIAKHLGVAYNTARVHRANVLKKMKARSVVELLSMRRTQ